MSLLILIAGLITGISATSYLVYKRYNRPINAVSETEFYKILKKKSLLEKFESGQILCAISGEVISTENLAYIEVRPNDELIFISKESVSIDARTPRDQVEPVIA